MKQRRRLTTVALLSVLSLAWEQQAATAQAAAPGSPATPVPGQAAAGLNVRQFLTERLAREGYRQITIQPTSFLVRAVDPYGNPVTLVVGPDGAVEVNEIETRQTDVPNTHPTPANALSETSTTTQLRGDGTSR